MKKIKKIINLSIVVFLSFIFSVFLFDFNIIAHASEKKFSGTQVLSATQTETVNYTRREVESSSTVNNVPLYYQDASLANSCGATAGAIVVGFYDKYYENLIPDYTTYNPNTGKYKNSDKTYIPALMQEFYVLMRINVDDLGVGASDCLNGLSAYVSSKNYSFSYSTVKTFNKISESKYLSAINANHPVLLFNGSTNLYDITTFSTNDVIVQSTISENHVYVGYGYTKIRYYNASGNFRTDTYLQVACGLNTMKSAYIKIDSSISNVPSDWSIYGYSIEIS